MSETIFGGAVILVCIFFGFLIERLRVKRSIFGTLRIDRSNPEKIIYRFEMDDIDGLKNKKMVVLKIDNNADLSQK